MLGKYFEDYSTLVTVRDGNSNTSSARREQSREVEITRQSNISREKRPRVFKDLLLAVWSILHSLVQFTFGRGGR